MRKMSGKGVKEVAALEIYLSENSDTDVLTAGFVDQRVQLLRWKRAGEKKPSEAALVPFMVVYSIKQMRF